MYDLLSLKIDEKIVVRFLIRINGFTLRAELQVIKSIITEFFLVISNLIKKENQEKYKKMKENSDWSVSNPYYKVCKM